MVTVTGAPAGFDAPTGVEACPPASPSLASPGPGSGFCPGGRLAPAQGGNYTLTLPAGSWTLTAGYLQGHGAVTGTPVVVTVTAGQSTTQDLTVAYVAPPPPPPPPGSVTGTVTVTGAPAGFNAPVGVEACPGATAPATSGFCPGGHLAPAQGGNYALILPAGTWTLVPGYLQGHGAVTGTPVTVTVNSGQATSQDLTVAYVAPPPPPGTGMVSGAVTVTGAPAGFDAPTGVEACPAAPAAPADHPQPPRGFCPGGRLAPATGGTYAFILPAGSWTLTPGYLQGRTAVEGTPVTVTVTAGQTTSQDLTVAYVAPPPPPPPPGTVTGTVTVTGAPAGFNAPVGVEACPGSTAPSTTSFCPGGRLVPAQGGNYSLTLAPGTWTLVPGYLQGHGAVTGATVTVAVTSGQTTMQDLTVAYQAPAAG
jgi:hypothetical protein